MTDRLAFYNLTLSCMGERKLATLTENREARRALDDAYDQVVAECIEEGLWNFMIRAIQLDASETTVPPFGFKYAFDRPSDWVRTIIISTVETFNPPLLDYTDEGGFIYCDTTPIFWRYISNDPTYGKNLGNWTANFTKYAALQLAEYTCKKITGSDALLDGPTGISARLKRARTKAKSNDAMNEPPGMMPMGTWARSRRGFVRGVPPPGGSGSGSFDD